MATRISMTSGLAGILAPQARICMYPDGNARAAWLSEVQSLPPTQSYGVSSYARGITFGGPSSPGSDGTGGMNLMYGVEKSTTEGNPSTPSIVFQSANMWRFRWSVAAGDRTISIKCKQAVNLSPRPTLVVKASDDVGLSSDLTGTAGSSLDWVTIGPLSFTASGAGTVWVEIWNNLDTQHRTTPCYFDHIVVT